MATLSKAELNIYIYIGNRDNKPPAPQYTLIKDKLSGEDIIVFEVAELIKDYIDVNFKGDYYNISQTAFAEFNITRTFDDATTDTLEKKVIAFTGYGEFEDGINPSLSKGFLISNRNVFVKSGELANIPVYQSTDSDSSHTVKYFKEGVEVTSQIVGGSVTPFTIDVEEIKISNEQDDYRIDRTHFRNYNSEELSSQLQIIPDIEEVRLTLSDGSVDVVTIRFLEECKHTPHKISFINKFGVIQDLWFFKRRDNSFEAERDDYKRSILNIGSTGVSYSQYDHSRQATDVRASEMLRMNTGFITEDHNEVIKQLMVTEHCWIHQDGDITPVVPKTTSFQEKKEVNEKLINFTVEFTVANNYIQDIR